MTAPSRRVADPVRSDCRAQSVGRCHLRGNDLHLTCAEVRPRGSSRTFPHQTLSFHTNIAESLAKGQRLAIPLDCQHSAEDGPMHSRAGEMADRASPKLARSSCLPPAVLHFPLCQPLRMAFFVPQELGVFVVFFTGTLAALIVPPPDTKLLAGAPAGAPPAAGLNAFFTRE
jgi:hypothetical protein